MALQCDPPWLGDIGDEKPEDEPDPDAAYEAWVERQREAAMEQDE